MNIDQTRLNANYQAVLNKVYSGEISLRDKYISPQAVIKHHCKVCMKNFYSRPLWLVSKKQPHECSFTTTGSPKGQTKAKPKKATETKKGNSKPSKVSAEMHGEMVLLYKSGDSMNKIAKQFEVTPRTVKNHLLKEKVEIRQM